MLWMMFSTVGDSYYKYCGDNTKSACHFPPKYWISSTVLDIFHSTDAITEMYSCYPTNVLMISLHSTRCANGIPKSETLPKSIHSTDDDFNFCIEIH